MNAGTILTGLTFSFPLAVVCFAALFLLWYEAVMGRDRNPAFPAAFAGAALVAALCSAIGLLHTAPERGHPLMLGALLPDRFGYAAQMIALSGALLALLASADAARRTGLSDRDLHAFLLFAVAGLLMMAQAGDLVVLALGLATASLSLSAMAGLARGCPRAREAAMKRMIPGAFATAILVYGAALLYAAFGTLEFVEIGKKIALAGHASALAHAGAALVLAALLFKAAVVPFHAWAPDVHDGAPTPVALFMAVAGKAAVFAALFRLVAGAFAHAAAPMVAALVPLAIVTMTFANAAALLETNLKRMLAWSTVAHAGVLLAALAAFAGAPAALAPSDHMAGGAMLFHLFALAFMNAGAFGCLLLFTRGGAEPVHVSDLSGVARRHPVAAIVFALLLLSLAGLPPLSGFISRFAVFSSAARAGFLGLALAGVLNALLSLACSLKVTAAMYAGPDDGATTVAPAPALVVALTTCLAATLALGVLPEPLLALFRAASFAAL